MGIGFPEQADSTSKSLSSLKVLSAKYKSATAKGYSPHAVRRTPRQVSTFKYKYCTLSWIQVREFAVLLNLLQLIK